MAIFNMVGGGGGGGGVIVPLDAIDDLSAVSGNAKVTIKRTDPNDAVYNGLTLVSRTSTKLVRKAGSAPTDSSDGTVVLTETTRNQYSSSGYVDSGLTNGTTYYYAAFAIGDNGTETISNVVSAMPDVKYLCFTANTAGSTVQLTAVGSPTSRTLETSTDKSNWTTYTIGDTITLSNIGDKIYWRNTSTTASAFSSSGSYYKFVMTGSIAGSGDVTYLVRKTGYSGGSVYLFNRLFNGCTALTTAPEVPVTSNAYGQLQYMFQGCTSLTTAPDLPVTTLAQYCYQYMFQGCTSLTTAPDLPATTAKQYCYSHMFDGCTALTTAPDLPATNLERDCYAAMFDGCTALTTAPDLPATTVPQNAYYMMFRNCSSLKNPPTISATTFSGSYNCYHMFSNCTSLETPPDLPATTLSERCYYYMFNGCTSLTYAPDLPATTLTQYCYSYMFYGCTALTRATKLPATSVLKCCYESMFRECKNLTTLVELPALTLADNCYYAMFYGCTKIKLSTTQTGDYQTPYRIPTTGTGTVATNALASMFISTGGSWSSTPTINTTYYTSNTVISND